MKKKAIALAVALTLGMGMFGSTTSAKGVYTGQTSNILWGISPIYNLSLAELQQSDEFDSIWINADQTLSMGVSWRRCNVTKRC
ncbi:Peptidoglycan-binding protein OS=Lysinibacillus sphaericus OX=1421 GN=LS41612_20975 PE=4 SV=1 [Lysinibacillus sphaericus]